MKNNINLDELFSSAKNAEPVFSTDDARALIENASIASTGNLYNKKIKGSTIMNIISAAVLTAAAIGIIGYNNLTDNHKSIEKNVQVVSNNKLDENKSNFNPNPTVAEIVNSSKNVETIDVDARNHTLKDDNNSLLTGENQLIKGVNVIELSAEEAKKIGIRISKDGDYIEYITGANSQKPELVKIYVDWGIGINKIHSTDMRNYAEMNEPRMITDNFGNKRLSTYNQDENSNLSKLEFMDKDKNLYIQSISSNDADKNVNIVMGGTANSIDIPNTKTNTNTIILAENTNKPEYNNKNITIEDEKVELTNSDFYYNPKDINNSSMDFTILF